MVAASQDACAAGGWGWGRHGAPHGVPPPWQSRERSGRRRSALCGREAIRGEERGAVPRRANPARAPALGTGPGRGRMHLRVRHCGLPPPPAADTGFQVPVAKTPKSRAGGLRWPPDYFTSRTYTPRRPHYAAACRAGAVGQSSCPPHAHLEHQLCVLGSNAASSSTPALRPNLPSAGPGPDKPAGKERVHVRP